MLSVVMNVSGINNGDRVSWEQKGEADAEGMNKGKTTPTSFFKLLR